MKASIKFIRNSEFRIQNSEFGIQNSEFRIRNSELWIVTEMKKWAIWAIVPAQVKWFVLTYKGKH